MTRAGILSRSSGILVLFGLPLLANAEPLTPLEVLRVTFDLAAYHSPHELETFEAFEFAIGVGPVEPVERFTVKLFDRGVLLGTYTGAGPGSESAILTGRFVTAESIYTLDNPTVIDFSAFRTGVFDGAVEFSIGSGMANLFRVSDDLTLGRAISPSILFASSLVPSAYEVVPVPEPSSVLLILTGAGILTARHRRRRTPELTG